MPEVHAVVEVAVGQPTFELHGLPGAWDEARSVRLNGDASAETVAAVIAVLVQYNRIPVAGPEADVLDRVMASEELVLPGGLRCLDPSGRVEPGCCSGLEDWPDWREYLDAGSGSPWMGHDPSPGWEWTGDTVRVWADVEPSGPPKGPFVDFKQEELDGALTQVEADLVQFAELLERLLERVQYVRAAEFARHFRSSFGIPCE